MTPPKYHPTLRFCSRNIPDLQYQDHQPSVKLYWALKHCVFWYHLWHTGKLLEVKGAPSSSWCVRTSGKYNKKIVNLICSYYYTLYSKREKERLNNSSWLYFFLKVFKNILSLILLKNKNAYFSIWLIFLSTPLHRWSL